MSSGFNTVVEEAPKVIENRIPYLCLRSMDCKPFKVALSILGGITMSEAHPKWIDNEDASDTYWSSDELYNWWKEYGSHLEYSFDPYDGEDSWKPVSVCVRNRKLDEMMMITTPDCRIFFRGSGNKAIYAMFNIMASAPIECFGNIETLLDYNIVQQGKHPEIAPMAFVELFKDCRLLTCPPDLPSTVLSAGCYLRMFENCTLLESMPELPATELAPSCYNGMFNGCSSLVKVSDLSALKLAPRCYDHMFSDCKSLVETPKILATEAAENSCWCMFRNCESLKTAHDLYVTALKEFCFESMFAGCILLEKAPELPATVLADSCYRYMFFNCLSLKYPPDLPAKELAGRCYMGMFNGCSFLKRTPKVPDIDIPDSCKMYMFQDCDDLMVFPKVWDMKSENKEFAGEPFTRNDCVEFRSPDGTDFLVAIVLDSVPKELRALGDEVAIKKWCDAPNIQFSHNPEDPNSWKAVGVKNSNQDSWCFIQTKEGKVYFRGANNEDFHAEFLIRYLPSDYVIDAQRYIKFSGNCDTLLDYKGASHGYLFLRGEYTFKHLFDGCPYLVNNS